MLLNSHSDKNGELYVVATPIGNKDDITIRALNILRNADFIAAEDTRHTKRLLDHHKIKKSLISYHEHNEEKRTEELLEILKQGKSVALVSDAGTPAISDPGYRLVHEALKKNIKITPVPGASALLTALCASGLYTDQFLFAGFLPKKKGKLHNRLKSLSDTSSTIIFYESPKRIKSTLDEIIYIMGDRYGVLARELTKIHEEFIRGALSEILDNLKKRQTVKGECTLLVTGYRKEKKFEEKILKKELEQRLKKGEKSLSHIVKEISTLYEIPKNAVYKEALKIKKNEQMKSVLSTNGS